MTLLRFHFSLLILSGPRISTPTEELKSPALSISIFEINKDFSFVERTKTVSAKRSSNTGNSLAACRSTLVQGKFKSVGAHIITRVKSFSNISKHLARAESNLSNLSRSVNFNTTCWALQPATRVVIRTTKFFNLQCTIVARQPVRKYFPYDLAFSGDNICT